MCPAFARRPALGTPAEGVYISVANYGKPSLGLQVSGPGWLNLRLRLRFPLYALSVLEYSLSRRIIGGIVERMAHVNLVVRWLLLDDLKAYRRFDRRGST